MDFANNDDGGDDDFDPGPGQNPHWNNNNWYMADENNMPSNPSQMDRDEFFQEQYYPEDQLDFMQTMANIDNEMMHQMTLMDKNPKVRGQATDVYNVVWDESVSPEGEVEALNKANFYLYTRNNQEKTLGQVARAFQLGAPSVLAPPPPGGNNWALVPQDMKQHAIAANTVLDWTNQGWAPQGGYTPETIKKIQTDIFEYERMINELAYHRTATVMANSGREAEALDVAKLAGTEKYDAILKYTRMKNADWKLE